MKIQILGPGCGKCESLAASAAAAADELGLDYELEKVTDLGEIVKFGVMMTPAMIVDGQVKVVGKVPSPAEIRELIADVAKQ